jgi:hypothetical protein
MLTPRPAPARGRPIMAAFEGDGKGLRRRGDRAGVAGKIFPVRFRSADPAANESQEGRGTLHACVSGSSFGPTTQEIDGPGRFT